MGFLDNLKKMWDSGDTGKKVKKKKSLLDAIADGTYEEQMRKKKKKKDGSS